MSKKDITIVFIISIAIILLLIFGYNDYKRQLDLRKNTNTSSVMQNG
ncbi:MAG: hypothetical protein H6696_05240 [Deferribacteres bacterium]|nr:hypothetical protein [candidate division KSB1 bacterium]MCB9501322.1 hypothetical protein [Deferribacteres bacterium]